MVIDPCIIADTIRTEAERQGIGLRELGRRAGVAHTVLHWWGGTAEREPSLPSVRTLERVCAVLGLRVSDVIRLAEVDDDPA